MYVVKKNNILKNSFKWHKYNKRAKESSCCLLQSPVPILSKPITVALIKTWTFTVDRIIITAPHGCYFYYKKLYTFYGQFTHTSPSLSKKNELWIQTLSVELFQFPLIQWDSAKCPRQNRCPRLCGVSSKHCPHECRYTSIPCACQSVYTEFCIFTLPPWLILYTSES